MELFIIRHAAAEERGPKGDDTRRALTEAGARKFRRAVEGLEALGVRVNHLLHSPWLRAVETAELCTPLLEGRSEVTELLAKEPSAALLHLLKGERVAVVGHEPWLSQLIAWLAVDNAEAGDRFVIKKGGVAWLSGEPKPGRMQLQALLFPKALRALKRK